MLDCLVASRPARSRAGTALSAVVATLLHGGLVAAAVAATWPTPRPDAPPLISLAEPYYAPAPRRTTTRGGAPPGPARPTWIGPVVDASGVRIPEFTVPDLPMDGLIQGSGVPFGTEIAGPPDPFGARGEPGGGPDGTAYSALTVDEPPHLLTLPALEYPALLRTAGLDGLVVIEVVIDSAGRPEPATLRVVEASHRGFVPEAVRVVTGARFRPGRVRGQAVRVLIRQPIAFRLAR